MPPRQIESLIKEGRLERVTADPAAARDKLADAKKHLISAEKVLDGDPEGAYALLYDAARKALDAHMMDAGIRVTKGEGGHVVRGLYGAEALARSNYKESVDRFDSMRRQRNRSEYSVWHISEHQAKSDLEHARAIVTAVEKSLASSRS